MFLEKVKIKTEEETALHIQVKGYTTSNHSDNE